MTLSQALIKGQYLTFLKILVSGGFFTKASDGSDAAMVLAQLTNQRVQTDYYIQIDALAGTTAGDVLLESGDTSMYNRCVVENGSGFAVELYGSLTSVFTAGQPALAGLLNDEIAAGQPRSITVPLGKSATFNIEKFNELRLDQNATGVIAAGEVKISLGNA